MLPVSQTFALALQHQQAGRLAEAEALYRQILAVEPRHADALHHLGVIALQIGRPELAVQLIREATVQSPNNAEAQSDLASAYRARGQYDEAVACLRRAIECRPDFARAHFNLGALLLLLGQPEEGWREYEWRFQVPAYAAQLRRFREPAWKGHRVRAKRIFVHAEQSFGDALFFVRYLPVVRALSKASEVIFECPPALFPLLKQEETLEITVIPRGESDDTLPPFDFHLPMLGMPRALECYEAAATRVPYLHADPALRTKWREKLGARTGLRAGLAWAGTSSSQEGTLRSIAPEQLAPLLNLPDVRFVSLCVEPRGPLPPALAAAGVLDLTADIADFSDSAALVAELDLIITVDTAAAHLAGALGRPVWTLLPFVPDWRWGLQREDTPWYPSMRLFRQTVAGDWEDVVRRAAAALRAAMHR